MSKKSPVTSKALLLARSIEDAIFLIRGERVMLDVHLAEPYGVATRVLVQAVKRNPRSSPDFTGGGKNRAYVCHPPFGRPPASSTT